MSIAQKTTSRDQYLALLEVTESVATHRSLTDLFHDLTRRLHPIALAVSPTGPIIRPNLITQLPNNLVNIIHVHCQFTDDKLERHHLLLKPRDAPTIAVSRR